MSRLVIRQVDAPAHALRFSSLLYTSYISYLLLLIHFIHFIVPHISLRPSQQIIDLQPQSWPLHVSCHDDFGRLIEQKLT